MSTEIQHPGTVLLEQYLQPLDITPAQLAKSIAVPLDRVSELIEGRLPITPDTAARLALFFDVPPHWWLVLQARYDAAHLKSMKTLRKVVTPYENLSDALVTPRGAKRLPPAEVTPAKTSKATFSESFLARLRSQVEWVEEGSRAVSEKILSDGTVALVGE